ncbi:hypothetical protein [Jannaschia rubra]|uniref:hypothetical protein n=1 Tax=Jannaschia rubra TaxID=282197 RepID=UPI002493B8E3|nr:hypothetical protein [Jannaschia rubra]
MLNAIKTFKNDEAGAVTVDWVVLTAALVGLGLAVMGVVSSGIGDVTEQISGQLTQDHITVSSDAFAEGQAATSNAGP